MWCQARIFAHANTTNHETGQARNFVPVTIFASVNVQMPDEKSGQFPGHGLMKVGQALPPANRLKVFLES
jgi:hypothetical protein